MTSQSSLLLSGSSLSPMDGENGSPFSIPDPSLSLLGPPPVNRWSSIRMGHASSRGIR